MLLLLFVVVVVAVAVAVGCYCSRIDSHNIKSVVTGQAPVILEWKNSSGKKINHTKPKVVHVYVNHSRSNACIRLKNIKNGRKSAYVRARSILVHIYVSIPGIGLPLTR